MVVIGGTRHPDELQEREERIFPPQRLHYLVLPPAAERAVAEAAIRFKISTSISRRAHRCSSVSSLAGSFLLRPDGRTTRASSPPLSVPLHPVSYLRAVAHAMLESEGFVVTLAAEIGFDDAKLELLGVAVVLPRPVYSPDAALVDPLPPKLHG